MKDCLLRDSTICHNVNAGRAADCQKCFLKDEKDDKIASMREGLAITQSLFPDEGIDRLKNSDKCVLCMGKPEPTSSYATVYMAHEEPPAHKRLLFGLGKEVRSDIGSLIPVEMASCAKCRRRHFWIGFIRPFMTVGLPLLLLVAFMIPAIGSALSFPWPIVIMAISALVGAGAASLIRDNIIKEAKGDTALNAEEVPALNEMIDKGWRVWAGGVKHEHLPLDFKSRKSPNRYDP
ncbi:MAG: hypothetical protein ACOYJD_08825 [Christensenellales bacterium]|jgi:hypothetical protein